MKSEKRVQLAHSGLPADIGEVIRAFDKRAEQQVVEGLFDASHIAGVGSQILASFDTLRKDGYAHPAETAVQEWWKARDREIGWEHHADRVARRLVQSVFPSES